MSSQPEANPYEPHRNHLLRHARASLEYGVRHGFPPDVSLDGLPDLLTAKTATFITLEKRNALRGCIGHLEPVEPLFLDIAHNAVSAALEDHRFPPVSEGELPHLRISISILTIPRPMDIDSEAELIANLRPGIDGLILQEGRRRATFLPSVWEELPLPLDFIQHLKRKAGLPASHWSGTFKVFTYQTHYLSET